MVGTTCERLGRGGRAHFCGWDIQPGRYLHPRPAFQARGRAAAQGHTLRRVATEEAAAEEGSRRLWLELRLGAEVPRRALVSHLASRPESVGPDAAVAQVSADFRPSVILVSRAALGPARVCLSAAAMVLAFVP